MKRLLVLALFVLGTACAARAQEAWPSANAGSVNVAANFSETTAADATLLQPENTAARPAAFAAFAAAPAPAAPAPAPKLLYGSRDDYRWQLGLGFAYVKFRSAPLSASLRGLNTSLAYFTNDWFGIEGNVTSAFGSTVLGNDRQKYFSLTGGPKIAWRQRRWEPWGHALFGLVRVNPQLAGVSRNGFGVLLGGGVDLRWKPRLAFRFEGDWVRSQLYSSSQNSFQLVTGFVFHF